MNKKSLDSYCDSIGSLGEGKNVIPYGGIEMVAYCYSNRFCNTIFPGIFYKDAVLSLISRSNSSSVFVYNQYSFEKAKQVFDIFDINILIKSRPYLMKKAESVISEAGLSVFFEQSIVPYKEHERLYVIDKLISFAYREPNRKLVICTRDYENSPHQPKITFQDIIAKQHLTLPENLHIIIGRSDDWLPRAEHVISVTSSVLLDAIYNGKSVTVLELPRSEYYGQGLFKESGLMCKEIHFPTKSVNNEWAQLHVTPFIEDEHVKGSGNEVFDFKLNLKNIKRILKANYLHFGKVNKDFVRYSLKNMVFFRKYHKIYLKQQRSNIR